MNFLICYHLLEQGHDHFMNSSIYIYIYIYTYIPTLMLKSLYISHTYMCIAYSMTNLTNQRGSTLWVLLAWDVYPLKASGSWDPS